jgi:hypothetical protein
MEYLEVEDIEPALQVLQKCFKVPKKRISLGFRSGSDTRCGVC